MPELAVYEGTTNTLEVSSIDADTTDLDVFAYLVNRNGERVEIGSVEGDDTGTLTIPVEFDTSGIGGGSIFKLEIIADPEGSPIVIVGKDYYVRIYNVLSLTLPSS